MAGLSLKVRYDDREVMDRIRALTRKTGDASPAFKALGEHLVSSTRKRFDTETAPDGSKWPDISEPWRKRKVAQGRSSKILTYLGRLRQSFVYKVGKLSLKWGTNVKAPGGFAYPELFQRGSRYQLQRVFLGVSKSDKNAALKIFTAFLGKK